MAEPDPIESVDNLRIRVGGLPQKPQGAFDYMLTFNVEGLLNEYSDPCLVMRNGELLSEGLGSAALDSPLNCVSWLANTLSQFGITLDAGDVVLSGSLVPLEPVVAGDEMRLEVDGIGTASVRFT